MNIGDGLGQYAPVQNNVDGFLPSSLQESLVEQPPATLPIVKSIISVVAPADLPEGYELTVSLPNNNNQQFVVKVPPGGVEAGQTFAVELPELPESSSSPEHIPVGQWKDGLWNLFNYGPCHESCLVSVVCPLLGAGQVMTRQQLTWNGRAAANAAQAARSFEILVFITIFHFVVLVAFQVAFLVLDDTDYDMPMDEWEEPTGALAVVEDFYAVFYYLYWAILAFCVIRVRQFVRSRYAIPGEPVQDFVCSCFCPCLVVSQLLRHTVDYGRHPGKLFSKTGVPDHVPFTV